MREIHETPASSSATSHSLDVTQLQAQEQRSGELRADKAPLTATDNLIAHVMHDYRDFRAHLETAEERRGLPPAPENQLYLGRDPQRYAGIAGCYRISSLC